VDAVSCTVTCEWHGAAFDIRTGEPTCPPAFRPIAVYATRVDAGEVWIELS
jgi:3-phenylpropionate/trans-cinnamate dioxygenase ferredoxin subunit